MKKIAPQRCRIAGNKPLDRAGRYFRLTIDGFHSPRKIDPGQFVHVKTGDGLDPYFRRAFSIAEFDASSGRMELIHKVVGRGTNLLARKAKGEMLDLIGPLGNRFILPGRSVTTIIVAGGVGLPPLAFLARRLVAKGYDPEQVFFFYGGRSRDDLIDLARIRRLGVRFIPCTDDGSYGHQGFVTQAVNDHLAHYDGRRAFIYGCGPEPMLAALQNLALDKGLSGELSLEAPMPCGVGVCLGCVKPSLTDPGRYVRVCYDGPVFKIGEVRL